MSSKILQNAEMLGLVNHGLGELRHTIDHPKYMAVVTALEHLLPDLLAIQIAEDTAEQVVNTRVRAADEEHDRLVRLIVKLLEGFELVADSEEEASAIAQARQHMLPQGLKTTGLTFAEEAAQAQLAPMRMTAEDLSLLRKLKVKGRRTTYHYYVDYLNACTQLGLTDRRRLNAARDPQKATPTQLTVRNQFGRVVHALRAIADLTGEEHELLVAVREAEIRAETRAANRGSNPAAVPADAGGVEVPVVPDVVVTSEVPPVVEAAPAAEPVTEPAPQPTPSPIA